MAQPNPSSSRASVGTAGPCPAQGLSLSPSLTCAGLLRRAAALGPGSDAVQQRAAEEPFVQLCLQGPDAQPDAHQPPLAADLQREGECQGQLHQAGVILYGDTGRERIGSHPPPSIHCWTLRAKRRAQHRAQSLAGTSQHCPASGTHCNRSSGCPREPAPRLEALTLSLPQHSPAGCSGGLCCSPLSGSPRRSGWGEQRTDRGCGPCCLRTKPLPSPFCGTQGPQAPAPSPPKHRAHPNSVH